MKIKIKFRAEWVHHSMTTQSECISSHHQWQSVMTDNVSSVWHSAQHPSGPHVRDCWLPLLWMSEQFLVLPPHCPLSCPLATVWANWYPTVAFCLCGQVAMGAHPSPRWLAGCSLASSILLFPFTFPFIVYNGFSTLSGSEDELLMYLSPMCCHVSFLL